jgi:Rha family phage regulatory protein
MELDLRKMVVVSNDEAVTDSAAVAKVFGKQHKDVLKAIRNLDCSRDFTQRNFAQCLKINDLANGKREPFYTLTKDGFMFLVMGFTGKAAAKFKEAFIEAFNWMASQIKSFQQKKDDDLARINKLDNESFARGSIAGRLLKERKNEKAIFAVERVRVISTQMSLSFS